MPKKREPLLFDRYLASKPFGSLPRKREEIIRSHMTEAKHFVLDADATRYIGEMTRQVPQAISYGQQFALPPFNKMWIEFPARVLYEAVTQRPADADSDETVAYFINWPTVYVVASNGKGGDPLLSPIKYKLFQPFDARGEIEFCQDIGISRLNLDAFFWGETLHTMMLETLRTRGKPVVNELKPLTVDLEELDIDTRILARSLRENHSIEIMSQDMTMTFRAMFSESAGEMRNIIAMLLFLNRTSKIQYQEQIGPEKRMIRSKPRTMVKHQIIRLKINPLPKLIKLGGSGGIWRRLHDVRAHFCHDRIARETNCLHDWVEQDIEQWRCMACGGLKWRRKAHQRGNREKGLVKTEYEVTE